MLSASIACESSLYRSRLIPTIKYLLVLLFNKGKASVRPGRYCDNIHYDAGPVSLRTVCTIENEFFLTVNSSN